MTDYVISAGQTKSLALNSFDTVSVLSGGTLIDTSGIGRGTVFTGGEMLNDALASGGIVGVAFLGSAVSTTVPVSALLLVSGGTTGTTVLDGGSEALDSLGHAFDTTVQSGGQQDILTGAFASGTQVQAGGTANVAAGGTASNTSVASSGFLFVESSGVSVTNGALLVNTHVAQGGFAVVSLGGSDVVTGGSATSMTVADLGTEYVDSGGIASDTAVASGGAERISSAGTAVDATIGSGGFEVVSFGGSTLGVTIEAAGIAYVSSGASVRSTTIQAGGDMVLCSGATAIATEIAPGGLLIALPGAGVQSASGTVTSTGAVFIGASSGPLPDNAIFAAPALGGQVVGPGAAEYALTGGSVGQGLVSGGGIEYVCSGGLATGDTIAAEGSEVVFAQGTASGETVTGGGSQIVSVGGTALATLLASGGVALVSAGGTALSMTVSGGALNVMQGGAIESARVSGGIVSVFGGNARDTVVASGGGLLVSNGFVAATVVHAFGDEQVSAGGVASGTLVDPSGTESVFSGGSVAGTTVSGTQIVSAGGTASGATIDAAGFQFVSAGASAIATTIEGGGQENVSSGGSAIASIIASGGGETVISGATADGATIASGGTLTLLSGGTLSGSLVLSAGAQINLEALPFVSNGAAAFDSATDMLTVTQGTQSATLQLSGGYTGEVFPVLPGGGGTSVLVLRPPCYCRGTRILTERGEVPVEQLAIGDRVLTFAGALRPIRWIGQRNYAGRFAATNPNVLPVVIRAGALVEGVPKRDLHVSPRHSLFLDGVLIPAILLTNGTTIAPMDQAGEVGYFHIELDSHDILLADGAPAESFVDDASRGQFQNAADYHARYPGAARGPARYCAPVVEQGEVLEGVRRRLARRAGLLSPAPTQPGVLRGRLSLVARDRIAGWARNAAAPDAPVLLRMVVNGTVIGVALADLGAAEAGSSCGFAFQIPGGLAPDRRHSLRVERVADGALLGCSEIPAAPLVLPAPAPAGTLRGHLDVATAGRIAGWAWEETQPDAPAALQILDNGVPIARVLANLHRADLAAAGLGCGRHGFDIAIPGGLAPLARHVIQVCSETDGSELPGSPVAIEPSDAFDAALEQAIRRAVASIADRAGRRQAREFLLAQAATLAPAAGDSRSVAS